MFDTLAQVLQHYEFQPRYLQAEILQSIPWSQTPQYPLERELASVLYYMRDVEKFTEVYFSELRRTPTGKHPVIKRFMERWQGEEGLHGDLLNQFLEAAGYPSSADWYTQAKSQIPKRYTYANYLYTTLAKIFGKNFSALHMVWGAINEMSTLQGYRRLITLSGHPVLEKILKGIMREEATHVFFYYHAAQVLLQDSKVAQTLARRLVDWFWAPVGEGIKPGDQTEVVVRTLFAGEEGLKTMKTQVNDRIAHLPGFEGFGTVASRIQQYLAKIPAYA